MQRPSTKQVREACEDLDRIPGRMKSATWAYILAAMRVNANHMAFTIPELAEHMTQQGWINPVQTIRRAIKDFVEFGLIHEMK